MTRIVWVNGPVFTGREVFSDGAVVAEEGRIVWVGERAGLDGAGGAMNAVAAGGSAGGAGSAGSASCAGCVDSADGVGSPGSAGSPGTVIDLRGRLLTPGWVNAHTHIYSALARGMALKEAPPANFVETLERLWWRLDRALDLEEIALSARLHGWECLRAGVTTIVDHHASQRVVRGSLAAVSDALEPLGLRACLCYEVTDREGEAIAQAGIEENVAFLESLAGRTDDRGAAAGGTAARPPADRQITERQTSALQPSTRRAGLFGLHAGFTVSDETLARSVREARRLGAGFHLHLAEDKVDAAGTVARMEQAGVLGPDTLCVHGVHLEERDLARLAATGTWLAHCPQSNFNNAVGAVRLDRVRAAGVRVALGTDGFTAHVVREALMAHLAQNHLAGEPGLGWQTVPATFLEGNAELASGLFGVELGRLARGTAADVVVWDYTPPTPFTTANAWGHLLFGLVSARADAVWIDGQAVLSGGRAAGLDEDVLFSSCREAARRLWERF